MESYIEYRIYKSGGYFSIRPFEVTKRGGYTHYWDLTPNTLFSYSFKDGK